MKFFRPHRLITAFVMLISMLFMQLAVAGYVCPTLGIGEVDTSAQMVMNGDETVSGCAGTDMVQPSLCHANDQIGNQSLDKPAAPAVQPFIAASVTLVNIQTVDYFVDTRPRLPLLLARPIGPPIAIRNCCFRI